MSLTPVKIIPRKSDNETDYSVQLSKSLLHHLKIKTVQDLKIMLGGTLLTPLIEIKNFDSNQIVLSESIYSRCSLPVYEHKLLTSYRPEMHILQLGPIIGLMTDSISMKEEQPNFRSIHGFCEELHEGLNQSGGFFYVFSPDQFSKEGFFLVDGKWTLEKLPVPDVIYNRIHSRRLERHKAFINLKNEFELQMIPFFNDRFLSKWEVYEHVKEEKALLPHLPDTVLFSKEHLIQFVQNYETVFIKPVHGSQGRNILKVVREKENCYSLQTSRTLSSQEKNKKYTLDELYQQITPFLHNRIFIIQQGIELLTKNDSSMDFRVLCHKNYQGQWSVTSMVARVASADEFVSNIAKGGQVIKTFKALKSCMEKSEAYRVFSQIKDLSLSIASAISMHESGLTGELGIDIGVDKTGHPWLIEVNSKPSKSFEDDIGKIRPSAKAIVQLCTMLAFKNRTMKE